jgi:essential nuclear protein 1
MPKEKSSKKGSQLRHEPLGKEIEEREAKSVGILSNKTKKNSRDKNQDDYEEDGDLGSLNSKMSKKMSDKINSQARLQEVEERNTGLPIKKSNKMEDDNDSDDYEDDVLEEDGNYDEYEDADMVDFEGDYVAGAGLSETEEAVVQRFLEAGKAETRTLADIIMDKIKEKEEYDDEEDEDVDESKVIPPKVVEVYTAVGKMLAHYKSGKLPKALKMLPHLKNWEDVLWLTRPDTWSPSATYSCTKIFCSNLNVKMAQRFLNLVLLEKCRDDIRVNTKLNYHLYMALKKSLFKPAAFYKGLLLPLALSQSCTLREATIVSSVIAKVSIPSDHSAAAILRLAEMPYSGSTSLFIKVLINKKYALPRRVIEALMNHFYEFKDETRVLPVIWHQSLLVFIQRYKKEFDESQRDKLKVIFKSQPHYQITTEMRRELFHGTGENNMMN